MPSCHFLYLCRLLIWFYSDFVSRILTWNIIQDKFVTFGRNVFRVQPLAVACFETSGGSRAKSKNKRGQIPVAASRLLPLCVNQRTNPQRRFEDQNRIPIYIDVLRSYFPYLCAQTNLFSLAAQVSWEIRLTLCTAGKENQDELTNNVSLWGAVPWRASRVQLKWPSRRSSW